MGTRDVLSSLQLFTARTKESNMCASFCVNAWMRARLATDRDLGSQRKFLRECLDVCTTGNRP